MKQATISHIKNHLSALLKEVEAGETIVIVNRDRPVARLEPVGESRFESDDDRLQRLERLGIIRVAKAAPNPSLADPPLSSAPADAELLRAVLEEREQTW